MTDFDTIWRTLVEKVQQFMAILETMGYECYKESDEIILKRAGLVQEHVPVSLVESHCNQSNDDNQRRKAQLRAILKKYRDMSADKEELHQLMRDKFGVSLVFLGSSHFIPQLLRKLLFSVGWASTIIRIV